MTHSMKILASTALVAAGLAAPASAATYRAFLDAGQSTVPLTPQTGPEEAAATGTAIFTTDEATQTLDFTLDVVGIELDQLWDTLVAAPVGPIHLHNGPAGVNGPIVIPFPLPFDAAEGGYEDTDDGFRLAVEDYAFSDAIALSGVDVAFDDFLGALSAGNYYINVHSDEFGDGEIRGQLSPIPLPAGAWLGATGLLALAGMGARRRRG